MCEKAEMLLDTAVISNGVVEEKSLFGVTRWFAIYGLHLLSSIERQEALQGRLSGRAVYSVILKTSISCTRNSFEPVKSVFPSTPVSFV
jgi:hypothetical protein